MVAIIQRNDRVIFDSVNGKLLPINEPIFRPDRANFVIVCQYGDWSGFRTLEECKSQFPELEERMANRNVAYAVVER